MRIAEPLGYDEQLGISVQSYLAHDLTLKDLLAQSFSSAHPSPALLDGLRATAGGIAALHTSGIAEGTEVRWDDELAAIEAKHDKLTAVVPWLAVRPRDSSDWVTIQYQLPEQLAREGRPFHLTYGGRTATSMAFRQRLAILGDRLTVLAEDEQGRPDLESIVRDLPVGGLVYVCGPLGLLQAVQAAAEAVHGADQDIVRFELFSRDGLAPITGHALDAADYELVLARSGHTLRLAPEDNILDKALALGIDVENDCREGICGSCVTAIISGEVDHRDLVMTKKEHAAMTQMMICVSRPTCPRLELDL